MSRIRTYENDATLNNDDRLIGTDSVDGSTKNFTLEALATFIGGGAGDSVTSAAFTQAGNTVTLTLNRTTGSPLTASFVNTSSGSLVHAGTDDPVTDTIGGAVGDFYFRVDFSGTNRIFDSYGPLLVAANAGNNYASWNDVGPTSLIGPTGEQGRHGDSVDVTVTDNTATSGEFFITLTETTYDADNNPTTRTIANNVNIRGARGNDGTQGATWLSGADAPTAGDGIDGDFYIETTAPFPIFQKSSGAWTRIIASLQGGVGPAGPEGPQGLYDIDIFQRATSRPDTPTGGDLRDGQITTPPTGWSLDVAGTTGTDQVWESEFRYDPANPTNPIVWSTPFEAGGEGPAGATGPRGADWFALVGSPITDISSVDVSPIGAYDGLTVNDIIIDGLANSPNLGNIYTVQAVTGTPGTAGATARVVFSGNIRGAQGTSVIANPGGTGEPLRTITIDGTVYTIPAGGPAPGGRVTSALAVVANVPSGTVLNNGDVTSNVTLTPSWTVNTDATLTSITVSGPGLTSPRTIDISTGNGTAFTLNNVALSVGSNTWTITAVGTDDQHMRETETADATITVTTPRVDARAGFLAVANATDLTDTNIDTFSLTTNQIRPNMITLPTQGAGFNATSYYWVLTSRSVNVNVFEEGGGPVMFQSPVNVMLDGFPYHAYRSTNTQIDRDQAGFIITLTLRYD